MESSLAVPQRQAGYKAIINKLFKQISCLGTIEAYRTCYPLRRLKRAQEAAIGKFAIRGEENRARGIAYEIKSRAGAPLEN